MSVEAAIQSRLDDRRTLLAKHVEMLTEALGRDEDREAVQAQLDLLVDEVAYLVDLYRQLLVTSTAEELAERCSVAGACPDR